MSRHHLQRRRIDARSAPLPASSTTSVRRSSAVRVALSVLAVLVLAFTLLGGSASARADGSDTSTPTARVRGELLLSSQAVAPPYFVMTWIRASDGAQGRDRIRGSLFQLDVPPGRYRLTITDPRPPWRIEKFAPTQVHVTAAEGRTTLVSARMRPGAAIGGQVVAGDRVGRSARVLAVNDAGEVWETSADREGRYALAGLPSADYSVFTYDARDQWVAKSVWVPKLTSGQYRDVPIALTGRSGRLVVDLYAGGSLLADQVSVTAVSRRTGQFWTAQAKKGSAVFSGVYPGSYHILISRDGEQTRFRLGGQVVRAGRTSFAQVEVPVARAVVRGTATGPDGEVLMQVPVEVTDAEGRVLSSAFSDVNGRFELLVPSQQGGLTLRAHPASGIVIEASTGSGCLYTNASAPLPRLAPAASAEVGELVLPRASTYQPPSCPARVVVPSVVAS